MERQTLAKAIKSPQRANHVQRQSVGPAAPVHPLLDLQRSIGNEAVQRLINSPYIQAKLQVSTPGDPYEQEADRVADTVMRMPEPGVAGGAPQLQIQPLAQLSPLVHRTFPPTMFTQPRATLHPGALVQRRAPASTVREDDEEKMLAQTPEPDAISKEKEKQPPELKLAENNFLQRQTRKDDDQIEETVQPAPPVPHQLEDEDQELVQTELMSGGLLQRSCTECEEEKQREAKPAAIVQRKSAPTHLHDDDDEEEAVISKSGSGQLQASSGLQQNLNHSRGTGTALPSDTRSSFESALGADFSGVQIHTGAEAVEMNKQLGAHAFTHGSDIYFNAGKYDPTSSSGKRLLAHELTHTVQQGGAVRTKKQPEAPDHGALKTTAPGIQASWYNFNIPFTDYQFDPSLQGVKNAANIVKDAAVEGLEWVVDQIKSVVTAGIDWLSDKWNSLKEFAASGFEAVKSAFTDIVGLIKSPLSFISNAIMNFDAESLRKAWAKFSDFVSGVWNGFKVVTDHLLEQVNGVWEGISGFATSVLNKVAGLTENFVFKKLPDALQKIAYGLINRLKSLWKSINDGWTRVFTRIKAWVDSALDTVLQFVNRVLSFAIDVVIEGIILFGKLVLFLKDFFADPQKYLDILAGKSVAAFDGLESRFAETVSEYFQDDQKTETDTAVTGTIQRQADPAAVPKAKSTATWGEIGSGVWKLMKDKWNEFKSHPGSIVTGLLLDMFIPIYGNVKDVIELFGDIKKIVTGPLSAGSLDEFWTSLLLILDIPILIEQRVIGILMRSLMVPLIIATFIPHPVVKGIAAIVGEALLAAFVSAELLNVGHKVLLLKTAKLTQDQKKDAYNRMADTFIGLIMTAAIMLIMLILHFIGNIMKGIYNFIKGKIFPVERAPIEVKGPAEGKGKGGPEEGKAAEEKTGKEVPTEEDRSIKMNEEGKCEVCASPCEELRKKYKSVLTPEAEAKIKAIESDAALSDAQKLEKLKPVEQELADLAKQRFESLSKDPQTGKASAKSIDEAKTILQAEQEGLVQKAERPDLKKSDPNLDFKIEGPPPFKFADPKTPVNRGNLVTQAEGIGEKIVLQKAGASDVLHIVDLKNIPAAEKPAFKANVLKGAGSPTGIVFINE